MRKMTTQNCSRGISRSGVLVGLGVVLLISAAGLFCCNQWMSYRAGRESQATVTALVEELPYDTKTIQHILEAEEIAAGDDELAPQVMPSVSVSGASYMGILSIPKLERILPVQDSWSLHQLKQSPCRYSGGVYDGGLVIAAHNYKTHFGGLGTLSHGDTVTLTMLDGSQNNYVVAEVCTVDAADIDGMVDSGYDLSLFTCTYGGKARLTVRCRRVF